MGDRSGRARSDVFLTDFGLARSTATGSRYTRTGEALGTPSYMSPEQARGEAALAPASDVWALGCVLYECLSDGRRAFDGDTPAAVIGAVLTRTPRAVAGHPRPLIDRVSVCLQKPAARRYQSARALHDDLRRVLAGQRPLVRPPRRHGLGWALAAGAAALLTTGGVNHWATAREAPPPGFGAPTADVEAARHAAKGWELRQVDVVEAERLLTAALTLAPAHQEWRIQLGLVQWANGDRVEAVAATWGAVPPESSHWTRSRWLQGLAWLARHIAGADLAALQHAQTAWEHAAAGTVPEATWAHAGLIYRGRTPEARALLGPAADWSASLLRGLIETSDAESRDVTAGIGAYSHALTEGVALAWAHSNRGRLRFDAGDLARAIADYDAALTIAPAQKEILSNRGNAKQAVGDLAGAIADFDRALAIDARFALALSNRGSAKQVAGDLAGAIADCDAAVAIDPRSAPARINRGRSQHAAGDLAAAVADYDAALAIDPRAAQAWFNRGSVRVAMGDLAGALADFDTAVALTPRDAKALNNRGCTRQASGDLPGAIADFTAAVALAPHDAEILSNRGYAKHVAGDRAGALADLDAALAVQPGFAPARNNRGNARQASGDFVGAIADYDVALQLDPRNADAWANRGFARVRSGDLVRGATDLAQALAVAPQRWAHQARVERALAEVRAARGPR